MSVGVLLVDDHPVVRSGLRAVFGTRPDLDILGEAATGEEALVLTEHLRPDVVLCDLRLGDGIDGVATTAALRALNPAPAVLILTTFDRDADILRAIEAGAAGYLLKDVSPDTIVEAIHAAARGDMVLAPELATRMMRSMRNPTPQLTEREMDVLHHVATGASTKRSQSSCSSAKPRSRVTWCTSSPNSVWKAGHGPYMWHANRESWLIVPDPAEASPWFAPHEHS